MHRETFVADLRSGSAMEAAQGAVVTILGLMMARYAFAMVVKNARLVWRRVRPTVD